MSNRGLTLVEVLVGASLVAAISVGVLSAVAHFALNSARASARQDAEELSKLLTLTLSNDRHCRGALREITAYTGTNLTLNEIYNGAGERIVSSATRNGRLWINQIRVENVGAGINQNIVLPEDPNAAVAVQRFDANLIIELREYSSEYALGPPPVDNTMGLAPVIVPIRIYSDPNGVFQRCMLSSASSQSCTSLGGYFEHQRGKCVFPVCNATVAADPRLGGGDCPAAAGCGTPIYFWGHKRSGSGNTKLVCLCTTACVAPTPPSPGY